jgi:hypothetical protein
MNEFLLLELPSHLFFHKHHQREGEKQEENQESKPQAKIEQVGERKTTGASVKSRFRPEKEQHHSIFSRRLELLPLQNV